jgi:hypothetical protein
LCRSTSIMGWTRYTHPRVPKGHTHVNLRDPLHPPHRLRLFEPKLLFKCYSTCFWLATCHCFVGRLYFHIVLYIIYLWSLSWWLVVSSSPCSWGHMMNWLWFLYNMLMRVNSTNVQYEGLRIEEVGRQMNSKVKSVKQGVYQK